MVQRPQRPCRAPRVERTRHHDGGGWLTAGSDGPREGLPFGLVEPGRRCVTDPQRQPALDIRRLSSVEPSVSPTLFQEALARDSLQRRHSLSPARRREDSLPFPKGLPPWYRVVSPVDPTQGMVPGLPSSPSLAVACPSRVRGRGAGPARGPVARWRTDRFPMAAARPRCPSCWTIPPVIASEGPLRGPQAEHGCKAS